MIVFRPGRWSDFSLPGLASAVQLQQLARSAGSCGELLLPGRRSAEQLSRRPRQSSAARVLTIVLTGSTVPAIYLALTELLPWHCPKVLAV